MKGLAFPKAEIFQFEVHALKNQENFVFSLFEDAKELTSQELIFRAEFCLRITSLTLSDCVSVISETSKIIWTRH